MEMYLLDDEDDSDSMVVPQTPGEEIRTRVDIIRFPPPLLREVVEDQI
ncbi:hypothetical protein Tco_0593970, partial [Tanacetum coccineum]